jgi:NAD(P)-dependent dehydrogenase (short-subunit alcohol dehydrogenase family)
MADYTSTILITGGTQGLGYYCALDLAAQNPKSLIILASRTDPTSSASTINAKLKQSNVQYTPLDLGSLATVRAFAKDFLAANYPPIGALVLNAGLQIPDGIHYTPDKIETHFAVNHVGHALLFHLLAPRLQPTARIVVVSSGMHDPELGKPIGIVARYTTAERAAHPTEEDVKENNGRDRYATSKAANVLWAFALSSHVAQSQHTVLAFDPGLMFGTNFARDSSWVLRFLNYTILPYSTSLFRLLMNDNVNTPQESGGNLAWLAMDKEHEGKKGIYFEKRKVRDASVVARDAKLQEELWKWTIEKVSESEEEANRFAKME